MTALIRGYFHTLGLDEAEAGELHMHYYKYYGLAIRGLVKHHTIDPLDYDEKCDGALPLEEILHPDAALIDMLKRVDRRKIRIYALTNAYKTHALRVLRLLQLTSLVQGIVFCDYTIPDLYVARLTSSCKPETQFYRAADEAVGARADVHHYFVDDSLTNVRAAQSLGWQSCGTSSLLTSLLQRARDRAGSVYHRQRCPGRDQARPARHALAAGVPLVEAE